MAHFLEVLGVYLAAAAAGCLAAIWAFPYLAVMLRLITPEEAARARQRMPPGRWLHRWRDR